MVGDRPPCTQKMWLSITADKLHSSRQGQSRRYKGTVAHPYQAAVADLVMHRAECQGGTHAQEQRTRWSKLTRRATHCTRLLRASAPEVVKNVCAVPPHVDGPILSQALVIKTIHLRTRRVAAWCTWPGTRYCCIARLCACVQTRCPQRQLSWQPVRIVLCTMCTQTTPACMIPAALT